jgi:MFS family permease
MIGDSLVPVATAFAVLEIGSVSDLGLVIAAAAAARAVFFMVGGVWADRLPRRLIMITADAVRAVVQLVIAIAFLTGEIQVWYLVASSAVFGAAGSFFRPASTGLLPQLVTPKQIQEANALLALSHNAVDLFGPVAAGILIASVGYDLIYAVDAATFIASLLCLTLMRPLGRAHTRSQSFLAEAREGIRAVMARSWMRVTIIADLFANFAFAPYYVLGPLIVREHLHGPPDWGLMMAASAVGGISGAALVLRWKPKRPLVVAYVGMLAAPLALLSLVPPLPLPLLMLGSLLVATALVVGNTIWSTLAQQQVPEELLGRVDAVAWTGSILIMPVAYALAGPVAEWVGVRETLIAASALGIGCYVGALLFRSVRELSSLEEESVAQSWEPAGSELEPAAQVEP